MILGETWRGLVALTLVTAKESFAALALCRVRRYNRPYGMIIVRGRWK